MPGPDGCVATRESAGGPRPGLNGPRAPTGPMRPMWAMGPTPTEVKGAGGMARTMPLRWKPAGLCLLSGLNRSASRLSSDDARRLSGSGGGICLSGGGMCLSGIFMCLSGVCMCLSGVCMCLSGVCICLSGVCMCLSGIIIYLSCGVICLSGGCICLSGISMCLSGACMCLFLGGCIVIAIGIGLSGEGKRVGICHSESGDSSRRSGENAWRLSSDRGRRTCGKVCRLSSVGGCRLSAV